MKSSLRTNLLCAAKELKRSNHPTNHILLSTAADTNFVRKKICSYKKRCSPWWRSSGLTKKSFLADRGISFQNSTTGARNTKPRVSFQRWLSEIPKVIFRSCLSESAGRVSLRRSSNSQRRAGCTSVFSADARSDAIGQKIYFMPNPATCAKVLTGCLVWYSGKE